MDSRSTLRSGTTWICTGSFRRVARRVGHVHLRRGGRKGVGERQVCKDSGTEPGESRGADRTRTDDFLLAKQALYQLSYGPIEFSL
jgi:hypothetical protein